MLRKEDKGDGMMKRLTKRIFIPKEERELVVFTQGEYIDTIPAEMTYEDIRKVLRKLAEYEDLEDRLNGVSVKQVVDGFIKTVENQTNEEYEHGRILTNAEADKWNEYRQLDEQGLLLRLPVKVKEMEVNEDLER